MKPLFSISVCANVALVGALIYVVTKPPRRDPEETSNVKRGAIPAISEPPPRTSAPVSVAFSGTSNPEFWNSPSEVQKWLQTKGAPLSVRWAVAYSMMVARSRPEIEAVRYPPGTPRWQMTTLKPTPEQNEAVAAIHARQEKEMKELFGADYAEARFGAAPEALTGIAVEKRPQLDRIALDYIKMRQKLGGLGGTLEQQRTIDAEFRKDLAEVLTPQELETYMAYESSEGTRLQQRLAGATLDDATYMKIFQASAQAKASSVTSSFANRLEEIRAVEKVAGPEVTATMAFNQDATFREIGKIYTDAGVPLADISPRYQAWLGFHSELNKAGNVTPGQLNTSQQATVRSYYDQMTSGLSTDQRASFDRTATGRFITGLLGKR